ncbi:hypothetical protein F5X97DRAFT_205821 [Nemania serpens]|nr:hypothetical protein F5X97DRAFT_205821 [Nemania serpens]
MQLRHTQITLTMPSISSNLLFLLAPARSNGCIPGRSTVATFSLCLLATRPLTGEEMSCRERMRRDTGICSLESLARSHLAATICHPASSQVTVPGARIRLQDDQPLAILSCILPHLAARRLLGPRSLWSAFQIQPPSPFLHGHEPGL